VGFVAQLVSFVLGESFADNFLLFPFFIVAIAAVVAAASTLVVAAYLR
jgi:hypothetical protein